jgi:hypothetical protein
MEVTVYVEIYCLGDCKQNPYTMQSVLELGKLLAGFSQV